MKDENEMSSAVQLPAYGKMLAEKIRTTSDCAKLEDFEKFILDRGWEFQTEEALRAGYDRFWKCRHEILITQDEFLTEAKMQGEELTREVYNALAAFVEDGKLTAADVYRYARFKWCIENPNAIIAYQTDCDKWTANNCDTEITEEAAKIIICEELGFEASRIKIIGTPYYDATDYNFIRFDCGPWAWLMRNDEIYQVYQ